MAASKEVLSDEELEALAEGVQSGEVVVGNGHSAGGHVVQYDFHQPAHLLKARLPALDMINERFGKLFQSSLFGLIHRMVEIQSEEVQMMKYTDFINSLPTNCNVNRVRINELHGAMLLSINAEMAYVIVDCFFGGPGNIENAKLDRESTNTERRVVERVLAMVFNDLNKAWAPVTKLTFDYLHTENRMQMVNLGDHSDVVVLSNFSISLNGVDSRFAIAIPYAMLEPLRPILASGVRKENVESDDSWRQRLRNRIEEADVDLSAIFAETGISLRELLSLQPGDFIPINMKETTTVYADDVPLFEGKIGMSNQATAVRLIKWSQGS